MGPRTAASGYIAPLDGMRAVSIGLVLVSHFGFGFVPGLLGVTIFFFISGYLITGHALAEVDRRGTVSLPNFYLRRVLRLYPALLVMIVLGGALFIAVGGRFDVADVLAATFYFANWWEIAGGFATGIPHVPAPFAVLWSLAVEEHYYLVFPVLVLALASRRVAFVAVLAALIVLVTAWRWHVATACAGGGCFYYRIEHGTDTRIDAILFGALLAALLASPWRDGTLRIVATRSAGLAGLALLAGSLLVRDPWFRQTTRFSLQGVGLTLLIGATLHGPALGWVRGLLSWRHILVVGRLSYSLYLWHWIVLCTVVPWLSDALLAPLLQPGLPRPAWIATVFVPMTLASVLLAAASYYGIEQPMLSVRRRFGSNVTADVAA